MSATFIGNSSPMSTNKACSFTSAPKHLSPLIKVACQQRQLCVVFLLIAKASNTEKYENKLKLMPENCARKLLSLLFLQHCTQKQASRKKLSSYILYINMKTSRLGLNSTTIHKQSMILGSTNIASAIKWVNRLSTI